MPEDLQELIEGLQRGDRQAYKTLVRMYQQRAFRVSFRILCHEEEALEAVQESFIRIWNKITTYRSELRFEAWIFRIFANTAIDRLRAMKRRPTVSLDEFPERLLPGRTADAESALDNREIARTIRILSEELPEKQKLVFILRDIEEMESEEVQAVLGMSEDSVKSNLWHARKAVRERLSKIYSIESIRK